VRGSVELLHGARSRFLPRLQAISSGNAAGFHNAGIATLLCGWLRRVCDERNGDFGPRRRYLPISVAILQGGCWRSQAIEPDGR